MFETWEFVGFVIGMVAGILYVSSPFWLPVVLAAMAWTLWVDYIRRREIAAREHVLLEIRIPKEIKKSPAAMEVILGTLYDTGGEGNFFEKYWKGGTRSWFSLEAISVGGSVHFLIWLQKKAKNLIETQIYSQYPGVEIYEVPDYSIDFVYDPEKNKMWGSEMVLTKADPYPIKTYVDYGVDSDKDSAIDPMGVLTEFLGSLSAGEQAWMQILIRAHKKEGDKDSWKDAAKDEIKKIVSEAKFAKEGEDNPFGKAMSMSEEQKEMIKALEKSTAKLGFDTGIRLIYWAEKDKFNPGNIGGFINSFKQYSSPILNGFKPANSTKFTYPWQDYKDYRVNKKKRSILDAYKRRSFFHPPHKGKSFVLNSEELATIYHYPGKSVATPTLGRISSKKAEPPSNLPI